MKKKYTLGLVLAASICASMADVEMRIWTDSDGTTLEAEFVEYLNGRVTLEAANGKQIQVRLSSLSNEDQQLVLNSTPPDLDIELNDSTDTENIGGGRGFDLDRTVYTFSLELEKAGGREYPGTMNAEVYIIGYNPIPGEYILLRKYIKPFTFANTRDHEIEIPLGKLSLVELEGNIEAGTEYEGYLVVLVDAFNRVFQIEGSRSKFEEHASKIRQKEQEEAVSGTELLPLASSGSLGYRNDRGRRRPDDNGGKKGPGGG